jgi:hypothetical protein
LIGIVAAVVAIGAVAYFVFPGIRAKIDSTYEKHAGWTPEARKKDPVGFIDYSVSKLETNIAKFESLRTDVRTGKSKLEKEKAENESKLKFNTNLLAEMKTAFKTASESGKWPVEIAGRKYDEKDLRRQVEVFLGENETFASVSRQLDQACKDIEAKEDEVNNRITESKSKLSMLKTQREIVKANALTADSEKLLAEVNDVLIQNEAASTPVVVRTTDEMRREAAKSAPSTPKADDFLKS